MNYKNISKELNSLRDVDRAKILSGFFKTGKGQYGYGDVFLGITVPEQRKIAKKYKSLDFVDIEKLLNNKIHEYRLTALEILVMRYESSEDKKEQKKIVDFYIKNINGINNWDLVDLSAPYILGDWLFDKDKKILFRLAKSKILWERRIAVISTFGFIYKGDYSTTLEIVEFLLDDKYDLIHKACGWMLREVGKRVSKEVLIDFLDIHHSSMPRTMLRYAIERLSEQERAFYLKYK